MNCCGQKRMLWKKELEQSVANAIPAVNPNAQKEIKTKVFEYLGNKNLVVQGVSSGAFYQFHFKGEKIEVDYYDSFAMMAEPDLRPVS